MRQSKNNGWLVFLFFFIIVGGFGGTILSFLLPLIIVIAIIVAIAVAASNSVNKNNSSNAYQRGYQRTANFRRTNTQSRSSFSAADIAKINVYLRQHFRTSRVFHIGTSLDLRVHTSTYASLKSLDVYRDGTYICSLDDFENRYPDSYKEIMNKLASLAKTDQPSEVFDAEVATSAPQAAKQAAPQEPLEKNAQYYINMINTLNNGITDSEITNGLFETTSLLKQIQSLELKFPQSKGKLKKLYDYYLPILIRVLKQFENLQDAKYDENYEPVKEKLTKTIHLINDAMRTIISSLTDADMMNLSADLSTLEALLQKDGLTGDQMHEQAQKGESHE